MTFDWEKHNLEFIIPAKTSRGAYTQKEVILLKISDGKFSAVGEISPLPDLSIDGKTDLIPVLMKLKEQFESGISLEDLKGMCSAYPSVQFAIDALRRQWSALNNTFAKTAFTRGKESIKFNGLIWMNDSETMLAQALKKAEQGFHCIKFKIGALDHDTECRMLEKFRKKSTPFQTEIRLDANGAFDVSNALEILKDFSKFGIHSIEQPIAPGNPEFLEELKKKSGIDIALDEDLIGLNAHDVSLFLKKSQADYLVLKPTLLGGFDICDELIEVAEKQNKGWWVTSALESNIGLGQIAQWVSEHKLHLHQGLGTGTLYRTNFSSDLFFEGENLWYRINHIN